jgi:hypothetical protein
MFVRLVVVVLFVFAVDVARSHATSTNSCESHIDKLDTCQAVISFSGDCYSSQVNLSDTEYSQCTSNQFFWSYPLNNMTLIIETSFTRSRQAYWISVDNQALQGAVSHVYRIYNGQETDVSVFTPKLVQYSDPNYQIILKFEGPTSLGRYGVNVNYDAFAF